MRKFWTATFESCEFNAEKSTLIHFRVTSLDQLCLAEFSGELVRPMVYENDHMNVLDIWIDLEWKVKYSTTLLFKVMFLCQKAAEAFRFFFIEEYKNRRTTFIIDIF
jgi:hypothetical protein